MRRFLLYLAVTDPDLVKRVIKHETLRQENLGLLLLLVAFCAAASGGYAIHTVFDDKLIVSMSAAVWGLFVLCIDRALIASSFGASSELPYEIRLVQKYIPLVFRLVLAYFLGIIISIPLEMRVFESEINDYLYSMEQKKFNTELDRIKQKADKARNDAKSELERQSKALSDHISSLQQELIQMQSDLVRINREGTIYRTVTNRHGTFSIPTDKNKQYLKPLQNSIDIKSKELEMANKGKGQAINEYKQVYSGKILEIEKNYRDAYQEATPSHSSRSFLTRYNALSNLSDSPENGSSTKYLQTLFRWIIILIEVMPILLKVTSDAGPYDRLLGDDYD